MECVVSPGETVFIKPNYCAAGMINDPAAFMGDSTKPEIVVAVAEACLEVGASEVIIGDGAQVRKFDWADLRTLDGSTNLAAEAQRLNATYHGTTRLACLNADSPRWEPLSSPYSGLDEILVSTLATKADRVISIPVIKTHRWTQVTASLKNLMGVISLDRYDPLGMRMRSGIHNAPAGLEQAFLDVAAALKPDLAIIDASICCEGNGPHVMPGYWGDAVDMMDRLGRWLVLASKDPVAADATAARIISHDVYDVDHLRMAYHQGMGQTREDLVELIGADLDELRVGWVPAEPTEGFSEVIIPGLMLTTAG
jgi:uncharacterized protein (DUF362 family)